jgi:hypothetical protein
MTIKSVKIFAPDMLHFFADHVFGADYKCVDKIQVDLNGNSVAIIEGNRTTVFNGMPFEYSCVDLTE